MLVLFECHSYQLPAGADAGFLKEALQDGFDVAFGDLEAPGDLLVGEAFEDVAEHLALTLVEDRGSGRLAFGVGFVEAGERAIEPDTAGQDDADAFDQVAEGRLLEKDAGHALANEPARFGIADPGRDDEYAAFEAGLAGGGKKLGGALGAEVVIEEDKIERLLGEKGEGFADAGAVLDGEIGLLGQYAGDALAKEGVIVDQENANGFVGYRGHSSTTGFSTGQSSTVKQQPSSSGS